MGSTSERLTLEFIDQGVEPTSIVEYFREDAFTDLTNSVRAPELLLTLVEKSIKVLSEWDWAGQRNLHKSLIIDFLNCARIAKLVETNGETNEVEAVTSQQWVQGKIWALAMVRAFRPHEVERAVAVPIATWTDSSIEDAIAERSSEHSRPRDGMTNGRGMVWRLDFTLAKSNSSTPTVPDGILPVAVDPSDFLRYEIKDSWREGIEAAAELAANEVLRDFGTPIWAGYWRLSSVGTEEYGAFPFNDRSASGAAAWAIFHALMEKRYAQDEKDPELERLLICAQVLEGSTKLGSVSGVAEKVRAACAARIQGQAHIDRIVVVGDDDEREANQSLNECIDRDESRRLTRDSIDVLNIEEVKA